MPRLDLKASNPERKRQLAGLVAEHLRSIGHDATVLTGHLNASRHRDQAIVESSIGMVHTTASSSTDPNASPGLWLLALKVARPVAAPALYHAPHAFWAPLVARTT